MSEQVENISAQIEDAINDSIDSTDASALSFDELDSLTDGRSEEKLLNAAEKSIEKKSSQKDEERYEGEGDGEEKSPEQETYEEEIKRILAKQGEEDVELLANTMFKHKVDGEEVDVDLQSLLNNYSGKVSYDKKFQEFSSQKKEFETKQNQYNTEIDQINNYINDFAEKFRQNDALGALEYFAEFAGMKPYEFRRDLLNQLVPEMERRSNMSEDQIRAEELAFQNEYLMRQHESAQQQYQDQQALRELENEIANVQEAHGISDEDFEKAYQELLEIDFEGEINPATVAEYYIHSSAYSKAESILDQVDPVLSQQDPVIESLQKVIVENPEFDDNDLLEVVQQVFSDFKKDASKSVSKKVSSSKKQKKVSKSIVNEDIVDFEDL